MAAFGLSYSRLKEAADNTSAGRSELEAEFAEFKQVLLSIDTIWESAAHEEFKKEFLKLDAMFEGYGKVINDFALHLLFAAEEYKKRDDATRGDVSVLNADALFRV